jgi:SAM-dependent methyltransferase
MLIGVLRELLSRKTRPIAAPGETAGTLDSGRAVLNVGGGSKDLAIPSKYDGWRHIMLDIDARGGPDIVCDARELITLPGAQFDAVYCSHNLEHYYKHDGAKVLRGFLHVLKPDGFAELRVPDMEGVMKAVVARNLDIEAILYVSPAGPISVRDVIYGWSKEIERSGVDFYAHKTGFTATSLNSMLREAGFVETAMYVSDEAFELRALAFKMIPLESQRQLLAADI